MISKTSIFVIIAVMALALIGAAVFVLIQMPQATPTIDIPDAKISDETLLEQKFKKVQARFQQWQQEGRDPSPIGNIMQEFESLMREGKQKEAEAVLDRALIVVKGKAQEQPAQDTKEKGSMSLDPLSATIAVGETVKIRAIFTPPRPACLDAVPSCEVMERMPYEVIAPIISDNPSIAIVDKTEDKNCDPPRMCPKAIPRYAVRGVAAGKAVISSSYITSEGTFRATMNVTVNPAAAATPVTATTQYLTFQIFTGTPDPSIALGPPPLSPLHTKAVMAKAVQDIINKIGITGDKNRKLGFTPGPLAFDHTDAELKRFIRESFEIAHEKNIAVAFHIDDSMFWGIKQSLLSNVQNVEWLDWNKTPNTGRRIDWAASPVKFAPQMCVNSQDIQKEIRRFAGVIGQEIKEQVNQLEADGKEHLFAGVIAGWETQIGRDLDTGKYLGYCALTNKGFSAVNPPKDIDREREEIVKEFIELWARALSDVGIPKEKIYSHTAFVSKKGYDEMKKQNPSQFSMTYSQINNFALPSVSFSPYYHPGFSTYPQLGLLDQISEGLSQNNNSPWASSEGTAIGVDMDTYLDGLLNRGAVLVNIFAWGVGPYVPQNPYRYATERPEAIKTYKEFLSGY